MIDRFKNFVLLVPIFFKFVSGDCVLPPHSTFSEWRVANNPQLQPNDTVPIFTVLIYKCHPGFLLLGNSFVQCLGDHFTEFPRCEKLCIPKESNNLYRISCSNETEKVSCQKATNFILLTVKCRNNERNFEELICFEGKWRGQMPNCLRKEKYGIDDCGMEVLEEGSVRLLDMSTPKMMPWNVIIKKKYQGIYTIICGGTLISENAVITAAHCFGEFYRQHNPANYKVIAGHYLHEFSVSSRVERILLNDQFNGSTYNYVSDIAVVITSRRFELPPYILPICFNWQEIKTDYASFPSPPINDRASVTVVDVRNHDKRTCNITKDNPLYRYYTSDKLCSSIKRDSCQMILSNGIRLAGGGGLVTKSFHDRYYLEGIISIASGATVSDCRSDKIILSTNIFKYREFITDSLQLAKNYSNQFSNKCYVPNFPRNGYWLVEEEPSNTSDFYADNGTTINFYCNFRYKLISSINRTTCINEKWVPFEVPICKILCPTIRQTPKTTLKCFYNDEETNCEEPITGTIVKIECADFYELNTEEPFYAAHCHNGFWNVSRIPHCTIICGMKSVLARPLIVGGEVVRRGEYPWQIAIYRMGKNGYRLICGGSLLNQRLIVSAAHCFTDPFGHLLDIRSFRVAAGKYYRDYNNITDHDTAQFQELESISVGREYRGVLQHYVGDIALLLTKDKFNLSNFVRPVCIELENITSIKADTMGIVTGWGFTVYNAKPSEVLKELVVPFKTEVTCREFLPLDWQIQYFTFDKFCAGHFNESLSACKGDSGGGLVFRNAHNNRFYIKGIVSVGTVSDNPISCNTEQYTLYTNISSHIDFIKSKLSDL